MASDHDTPTGGASGGFPATHHSAILALRGSDQQARERALETIASVYWRPVYTHIRIRWNRLPDEAGDLTQGFFVEVLEKETFATFDPARARFRTFLRVCLDRYIQREDTAAARQKRGGDTEHMSLDVAEFEHALSLQSSHASPEDSFDREWVRSLFTLATTRLSNHCETANRTVAIRAFQLYDLEPADSSERPTYAELATRLDSKPDDITNQLAYARKEFRRIVLELLRELTVSDDEFREEARALLGIDVS